MRERRVGNSCAGPFADHRLVVSEETTQRFRVGDAFARGSCPRTGEDLGYFATVPPLSLPDPALEIAMRFSMWLVAALLAATAFFASSGAAENWPQWRGPTGQGHAPAAKNLPTEFGLDKNLAWRVELPGKGWSSPVIADGEIWMTTAVETPISEEEFERRTANNTGGQPLNLSGPLSMRALCVDQETGKLKHNIEMMVAKEPCWIHTLNSYASPTPILEDGKLYCHFGANGTCCLDTQTGEVLWTNDQLKIEHENGPGSTPVLHKGKLIVHCDGSDLQYIVALDASTGKIAWKTKRSGELHENPQLKKAYGTPLIVEVRGEPLLMSPGADWLYAYDPQSGEERWKLNYGDLGFSIVPRPVAANGRLYFSTSFVRPKILCVDYTSEQPKIMWKFARQAPQMPSPLVVDERLYLVSDRGIATCVDSRSGAQIWQARLGGRFASSPLYADGKIYVGNMDGEVFVLQPGDEFKLLAKNQLEGDVMATPAALGEALYIRTRGHLYRIERP